MSALGDQFRDAAEWLSMNSKSGCCEATEFADYRLFSSLFGRENDKNYGFWWRKPPNDHLARLIALDLAALIADEDV
jgi:hypothetical protein